MTKFAYIAGPYSSPSEEVIERRYDLYLRFTNMVLNHGIMCMSPLTNHACLKKGKVIPGDYNFWGNYSREMLARCQVVFVMMLDGWEKSDGVYDELMNARQKGLKILFFKEEDIEAGRLQAYHYVDGELDEARWEDYLLD